MALVMPEDWAQESEDPPEHSDHKPPSVAFSLSLQTPERQGQGYPLHLLAALFTSGPSSAAPS